MSRYYYVSLGSNIEPEKHFADAFAQLSARFGTLLVMPVVKTSPCAIDTANDFLNTLVVFASTLSTHELKAWFNQLETQHGRDRNDPMRSAKDRTLDLDILASQEHLDFSTTATFEEPYTQACVDALIHPQATQEIVLQGQRLGHRASAIDTDHRSGHIFVIEDTLDRLLERLEPAFNREQGLA